MERVKDLGKRIHLALRIKGRDHDARFGGWLMFDPEHRDQLPGPGKPHPTHATLWEIHPITKIEVFRGGAWKTWMRPERRTYATRNS